MNMHHSCMFFGDHASTDDPCQRCPVRQQCEQSATADDHGLFGGVTHSQRRKTRRQTNAAA